MLAADIIASYLYQFAHERSAWAGGFATLPNCAYQFNGSEYISVPGSDSLNDITNTVSISVWIHPDDYYPGGGVSSWNKLISVLCKGLTGRQYGLQISQPGQGWLWNCTNLVQSFIKPLPDVMLSTWQHVALTWDGETVIAYVDGVSLGTNKYAAVLQRNEEPLFIGKDVGHPETWSQTEYYKGAMDDLRIYNRALTSEEVVALCEGYSWQYIVLSNETSVTGLKAIDPDIQMPKVAVIPTVLGGCPVTSIDSNAFADYTNLTSVTIPASVTEIGSEAFNGCENLADVWFEGDTIGKIGRHAFLGCYWDLIMHVPAEWQGRGRTIAGYTVWRGGSSDVEKSVNMTVTNVVVQYVLNSIRPEIAVPVSNSVGFVNIITEVASSGAVSVPTEWKENYQQFETKFGTDFGKALAMKTGKKDGAGNDMFVWQDFVAGTDPTDENDQFTASIAIVDGVPVISYTPELTAEQAALRVYKTYGKMKLTILRGRTSRRRRAKNGPITTSSK